MEKIICSGCLLGLNCRYDSKNNRNEAVLHLAKDHILIPVCPEQLGGQSTPRPDAEIVGGTGGDVLDGKAKVLEPSGADVTEFFIRGAHETLNLAKELGAKKAILKQRSPSCGSKQIYDGSFTHKRIDGEGVATALLRRKGITVISEDEL